jgi:hypothetical protein
MAKIWTGFEYLVVFFFFFCDKLVQILVENIIDLNYFDCTVAVAVIKC